MENVIREFIFEDKTEEDRDHVVTLRVTDEEKNVLKNLMEEFEVKSYAALLRGMINYYLNSEKVKFSLVVKSDKDDHIERIIINEENMAYVTESLAHEFITYVCRQEKYRKDDESTDIRLSAIFSYIDRHEIILPEYIDRALTRYPKTVEDLRIKIDDHIRAENETVNERLKNNTLEAIKKDHLDEIHKLNDIISHQQGEINSLKKRELKRFFNRIKRLFKKQATS